MLPFAVAEERWHSVVRSVLPDPPESMLIGVRIGVNLESACRPAHRPGQSALSIIANSRFSRSIQCVPPAWRVAKPANGRYHSDGTITNWLEIKNPQYTQVTGAARVLRRANQAAQAPADAAGPIEAAAGQRGPPPNQKSVIIQALLCGTFTLIATCSPSGDGMPQLNSRPFAGDHTVLDVPSGRMNSSSVPFVVISVEKNPSPLDKTSIDTRRVACFTTSSR
jgi:hypothetical protein